MRILQVIPVLSTPFGGPVRVARSISKELAKRHHEVAIYTTSALDQKHDFKDLSEQFESEGYRVTYFPRIFRFSGFNISPAMAEALKDTLRDFDIVHLHSWRQFQDIIVRYYAKRYDVPYVLQAHGSIPRVVTKQKLKWIYDKSFGNQLLNDASKVIALSQLEALQYHDMGVPTKKIEIIPNGIDLSEFNDLPPTGSFKKKFSIGEKEKIVSYVGRVHKRKGIDFLLEAFANLENTDSTLVIAGPDDGYTAVLKEKAAQLKINERVMFTGFLSERDKLAAYVDSEVVVYPGIYEAFPLVPIEAALCSRPAIVSDDSVMAEIVIEGGFGLPTHYGDVTQLKEHLQSVLNNPKIAAEMGRKGRDFVKANYNWQDIVSRLERVYSDTISASHKSSTERIQN